MTSRSDDERGAGAEGSGTEDDVAVCRLHGRRFSAMGAPARAARHLARRAIVLVAVAVGLAGAMAVAPGVAGAAIAGCPEANPTYFDACGPTFTLPAWGDAAGWTDPSKSSTIQLADINGDGTDELIARNDQGLEIYWFDTAAGQWRPQVDANGVQQVLTDFASPAPGQTPATDWTKAEYYSTIQTAHIDGNKEAQILARFADGMRVYYFKPGPGGSINGGSWSLISSQGPFSDAGGWNDPSQYLSIRTGDIDVSDPGKTELIGRSPSGLVGYKWNGSGWSPLAAWNGGAGVFSDSKCGADCYSTFKMAHLCSRTAPSCPTGNQALVGHDAGGVEVVVYNSAGAGRWELLPGSAHTASRVSSIAFSDYVGGGDCPLPGATSQPDCFGSSPSYYDTFGVGDIDGDGIDEIYARGPAGLMVKKLNLTTGTWTALPTLPDLGGDGSNFIELVQAGLWGSIRTADLDGAGKQDVLALTGSGLQVWSYDPTSTSWQRWTPSTSLQLSGWTVTGNAPYYATLTTGDANGDGHDDLIARGPYGIRTWFYNRRGTGGWERYLPSGYADFSTQCPPGVVGQQAAFCALNARALRNGAIGSGTIRDVWTGTDGSNATTLATTLATLQVNLAGSLVGNCSSETNLGPPTYASCVPPAGSSDFTAGDWTAVVNEMLSEAYWAEQVVDQFSDLDTIRRGVFESETGSLPAIANDLQIAGAAGNTADFNLQGIFAGSTGIAASIAGVAPVVGPELSAALWVASELFSMLPSASPTANSSFQTTYSGLLDKLATAQDEMSDQWRSQLQQVLGDQGLLDIVGQLRSRGTWKLDVPGMISASRESFALQTYQALLPTLSNRYVVTNCTTQSLAGGTLSCELPTGPYVISSGGGLNATWIGPQTSMDPCPPTFGYNTDCNYPQNPGTLSDNVANIVWGAISDTCNYVPGNPNTVWHYGCSLGVPIATSIGADSPGWSFPTETGGPKLPDLSAVRATPGIVRADASLLGSGAAATHSGLSAVMQRETLGPLRFSGHVFVSSGLRLRRMRVVVERTLFEHGRRDELARSGAGRPVRPFPLSHMRDGLFATRRSGVQVRLKLRRLDRRGDVRLDLRLTVHTRDIRALCGVLPASVSLEGRPLELETRLRLRDRGLTGRISMRQRWRCVRDRMGEFVGIKPVEPRPPAARRGLAVHVQALLTPASGRRATVLVMVTNTRRRHPSRVVSSLWNLRISGTAGGRLHTIRLKELRAGRSRTIRLTLNVPTGARGPVCVRVAAGADSARPAGARRCARAATTAPVAGLGAVRPPPAARGLQRQVTLSLDHLARAIGRWAVTL